MTTTAPVREASESKGGLSAGWAAVWAGVAVGAFQAGYEVPVFGVLMCVYLYWLVKLTEVRTARRAFWWGFGVGMGCVVPQLWFFWGVFGWAAVALWAVLAFWIGVFVLIGWGLRRVAWVQGWKWAIGVAMVWMGLEYFRCELYWLRFAWLTPGMALGSSELTQGLVGVFGVYGIDFVLAAVAAACSVFPARRAVAGIIVLALLWFVGFVLTPSLGYTGPALHAIAIQLETPSETQVLAALDKAAASDPYADWPALLVMSEYTLASPPTPRIRDWCRDHGRYLLIGGIQPLDPLPNGKEQWANTAFVVDPEGNIVFTQGKCVPIQFFDDGVPAKEQQVWNSPWGKIGICICYDLSYSRVTDKLIEQDAKALIVIAMDAMSWGEHEHTLHARIALARAAEYHIDILRVASSGVTQNVSYLGDVRSIPYPAQGVTMLAGLKTRYSHSLPPDRYMAPVCVGVTAVVVVMLLGREAKKWWGRRRTE